MTAWCGVFLEPAPGLMWSAVLYGVLHHPDAAAREELKKTFGAFTDSRQNRTASGKIATILRAEQGTPLEPFELLDDELPLISELAAATLKAPVAASRFRVVSRDTLDNGGGLVITRGLRHYFAERFARGRCRAVPRAANFVAPALEPTLSAIQNSLCPIRTVSQEPGPKGVAIRVLCPDGLSSVGIIARNEIAVEVPNRTVVFSPKDLAAAARTGEILIEALSPEGIMRLTAAATQRAVLRLGNHDGDLIARIRLAPPGDEPVSLSCAIATRENPFEGWLALGNWPPPDISENLQQKLGTWLAPANDWRLARGLA